ncbi:MAG: hypothetical protein J6K84_03195 [Oscillospiraceae bacterium]|nr:hypothetical protein [Oscillospiraceae bacterium]
MKKIVALMLALVMVFALVACGTEPKKDIHAKGEGVMTYAQYEAAAMDSEVVVETFVQAKQGWWEKDGVGVATLYTQDKDGAYFLYNMPCSKEDYDKMVTGTKLKVTGFKSTWDGEIEIIDATYEILEGNYVAEPIDVTDLLGKAELEKKMNMFASFKGLTIEASNDEGAAFLYKWNGTGQDGDDLYFNASLNGETYTFCVESYLCGKDTDVYKAVKALKVGDKVDMEGFLYWYNGAQPHITSVK